MSVASLLLAFVVEVTSIAGTPAHPPKLLKNKHLPDVLTWVDKAEAFNGEGQLRTELAAWQGPIMQNARANSDGTCKVFMVEPPLEVFHERSSLTDAARSAKIALSGTVVSTSEGFLNGFPGTLIGFRITGAAIPNNSRNAAYKNLNTGNTRYTFVGEAAIRGRPPDRFVPQPDVRCRSRVPATISSFYRISTRTTPLT